LTDGIEIYIATDTERPQWDRFVQSRTNCSPYHLFGWGTAISQAYGHPFFPLIARRGGRIVGVLPLVHLRLPFLFSKLVALPFCDIGNCLSEDRKVEERLLHEAVAIGGRLNADDILLRGPLHSGDMAAGRFTTEPGFDKVRMLLELPSSSEAIFAGLKSKVRSQVRKAEKNGVIFRWAAQEGVEDFYRVFCVNMRDLGSPVHSKRLFTAVMDQFGDNARIGLAEYEGKCIGAGLILSTRHQTTIPWASTLRQYNRLNPNMLLYWNFLKFAADHGKKTFDFGRSTENEGTFSFKKQWGARPVPLLWYSWSVGEVRTSKENIHRQSHRSRLAAIWQKMPVPLANALGPPLRKYIHL